jgi:hypothetical protein
MSAGMTIHPDRAAKVEKVLTREATLKQASTGKVIFFLTS